MEFNKVEVDNLTKSILNLSLVCAGFQTHWSQHTRTLAWPLTQCRVTSLIKMTCYHEVGMCGKPKFGSDSVFKNWTVTEPSKNLTSVQTVFRQKLHANLQFMLQVTKSYLWCGGTSVEFLLCYISAVVANVLANLLSCYLLLVDTSVKTMVTNWIFTTLFISFISYHDAINKKITQSLLVSDQNPQKQ